MNLLKFLTALTAAYTDLYASQPDVYSMAKARYTPEELSEKMTMALKKGDGSKDGDGIKRVCKELKIAYTYKAIRSYLS